MNDGHQHDGDATIEVIVRRISYETPTVLSYDLRPTNGGPLPSFEAGAHIDVHLPDGLVRQYSLIGLPDGADYRIAVALDRATRGGSRWLHSSARPGDRIRISQPRSTFALEQTSAASVLIAGGIGITPLLAMARQLHEAGTEWTLHYAVRSRGECALLDELSALGDNVHLHVDSESDRLLDIERIVAQAAPNVQLYCCGPAPMLDAFMVATSSRDSSTVHYESFTPTVPAADDGGFTVVLNKSGLSIHVGADQTILDALEQAGVHAPSSCRNGVCGTCETSVLEGVPDHRDKVLSDGERAAGNTMMICCSRATTALLRLDR
ncbi:PDR/VanB family oxidoreductase [Aminobacter sp. AP02]|uniref:PDR/VanB family oxidoreductase n=1 Tax=Aminobacter sp. AP02 TaxID=2135737 RepID=UPI000D6CE95D|nr:PDR/VanB family oxidoreductase [Aminobacter sp. AP02]PWK76723.1 vanillate O-demethylase ferredoxin subunit [Aminobacter sp. AP02]